MAKNKQYNSMYFSILLFSFIAFWIILQFLFKNISINDKKFSKKVKIH